MKTIDFSISSIPGKGKENEDYILCHRLSEDSLVAILADGMGGLSYGAFAAKTISESILTAITENVDRDLPTDLLRKAFDVADSVIREKCIEMHCKMGAAVTVALIIDNSLYYAWQGNVRLYIVSHGELLLLTTDHIAPQLGGLFLTQCVNGKGYREDVPVQFRELEQDDKIFICSDGFYQHVQFAELITHDTLVFEKDRADDCSIIEIFICQK